MKPTEQIVLKSPETEAEWAAYYALRHQVLRQPWNQPAGTEKLPDDPEAIHALAVTQTGEALAAGRLHQAGKGLGQLRMMAVHPNWQGKGIGRQLAVYLEQKARDLGLSEMVLDARQTAVPFYQSLGYSVTEESYLLFGTIQHYRMRKKL